MSAWWAYIYPTIVGRFKPTDSKWNVEPGSAIDSGVYLSAFKKVGRGLTDIILVGHNKFGDTQSAAQQVAKSIKDDVKNGKSIFLMYNTPEIDYRYDSGQGVSQGPIKRLSEAEVKTCDKEILAALGRKDIPLDLSWE